jgi:hypothetical protein
MSSENGAGVTRSKRTRAPFAVVVNCSAPLPPFTSTVSAPSPPSSRSVSSPGFQIIRSLPPWPKTWSSASPPVRVSLSPPPNRRSSPPFPSRVSLPACPKSWSAPEPPVSVSLSAPPNRLAAGRAPFASLRLTASAPPSPKTRISDVLATVGVPPPTAIEPPLTRILPAASRLIAIELPAPSPVTDSTPAWNVPVVAALADGLAARVAARPRTMPTSSLRQAERRSLSVLALIMLGLLTVSLACTSGVARAFKDTAAARFIPAPAAARD